MPAGASVSLLLTVALAFPIGSGSSPGPQVPAEHRVLLLAGDDPAQPYVREVYEGFRDVLASATTRTLVFREFFDVVRFGDRPTYASEFRSWLTRKYRDRRIDVVIATTQPVLDLIDNPDSPWTQVPRVYGALGPLPPELAATHPTLSGVVLENHIPQFLRLITTVLPNTRSIAFIRGSSAAERERDAPLLMEIERQGLAVQDLGGLAMDQILDRVATLRGDTVPVVMGFQVDAAGQTFQSDQAIRLIARAAARPVFTINPADISSGATGGLLLGMRVLGEELARATLAVLAGEPARTITVPATRHASAVFDARELARWGIPEQRLPPGSTVLFRQPSLWRDYRRTVLATIAVGLVQTLLIVAILVQRGHRARAQAALSASYGQLRHLTGKLITAQEEERARIARNLHDDIGQRLASVSIGLSGVRREAGPAGPLGTELSSLQQAVTAISGELRDLSHDLHPGILEHVGLVEALRARCDELAHDSGAACRLDVSDEWRDVPDEVALCLYRVAQEALRNVARHAAARHVVVALDHRNGHVSMSVMDDGRGFAAAETKQGLGLLSLNERVSLLGGHLDVTSARGTGTTLAVRLPLMGMPHAA